MSEEQQKEQSSKAPVGKGILITVIVIVAIVAVMLLMGVLGLPYYIGFMGLTMWSAIEMSFNLKDIVQIWVSTAVALVIGYLLGCGMVGMIIAVIGIILLIFAMCTNRLTYVFNKYTAIVLVACSATGIVVDPIPSAEAVVFGFLVFGILPYAIMRLVSRAKAAD